MKDWETTGRQKADTDSLEGLRLRLVGFQCERDWKGYARETKRLARVISKAGNPLLVSQLLDICLAGTSQLVSYGHPVSARATLDPLWKPIKQAINQDPVSGRFFKGWALTILGDIESDSLAYSAAHKAYRKAITALSFPDTPVFYLPNAMIRKGATELVLGKTATARKTLEGARVLVQQLIDDKKTSTYAVLQLATILSLSGYTWLLSGRNFARANDLFTQSYNICNDSLDHKYCIEEFVLAKASALSGISSVDFLQNRKQQAEEHARVVAKTLFDIYESACEPYESAPDYIQPGSLASKALVKLAAMTYDPEHPEKTSVLLEDADGLISHLEQRPERPELSRHALALSQMVRAGIARKHNDIVTVKSNTFTAINIWKKLITKGSEPEFIANECQRLCGLDLLAPGHSFIRLSDVKSDEPIRGKFAVLQARTPLTNLDDLVDILP